MEEEAIPILSVVVPAVAGAVVVVVTVVLVFWLGAGRQTSYEDAVKARQGHADRELRRMAEKEKEQKQKREKRRPPRSISKRHEAGKVDGQGEVEATPQQLPQKSILKTTTSKANNVAKDKGEPVSGVRVDFEVSETPAKPSKTPRTNPPTPHPSAHRGSRPPFAPPLARALETEVGDEEEDEELDEEFIPRVPRIELQQKKSSHSDDDQPRSKPKTGQPPTTVTAAAATKSATATTKGATATTKRATVVTAGAAKTATAAGAATSRGQKKTKKGKSTAVPGELEALPASRISDIVGASPLTDEEIQHLIDKLLEMQDANAEWKLKGASRGTESVKSLKKANEDLQERCQDAENTVRDHYQKIKKLEAEIGEERHKRQTSERQLQMRIGKQSNEITIFKSKLSGLEEELKQTKQLSTAKLEEENTNLNQRINTLVQENSSLSSQLVSIKQSLQESQEQTTRFRTELHKAKSAAKSPTGGGAGQLERAAELEGRLQQVEGDNASLQAALISVRKEKDDLAERVQTLTAVSQERDSLAQQLSSVQEQLQEAQVAVKAMEQKGTEGEASAAAEISRLQQENAHLGSQVDALHQQSAEVATATGAELHQLKEEKARLETLQRQSAESATAAAAELQRLREANTRLGSQVEGLQQQSAASSVEALHQPPQGPSLEEVEEIKSQLKAAHQEDRQALVAKMEAERTSEVAGLKVQYEAELLSIKEELSRVQREGDAKHTSVEQRLASETAEKKDLQFELERLKATVLSSAQQNGPLDDDQVDAGHEEELRAKEEELLKVADERDSLIERVKTAEAKLTDLQSKNNSLRDNCWKARDDSAKLQKESETKLNQVYRDTENRVKEAEVRVAEEKEEGEKALLQRLFPDVRVAETTSFSAWVDQFELEAQLSIDNTKKQVCELKERVSELEETEQTHIQQAQVFRETLNKTFGNLAKLQEQVTSESVQHQRLLEEREEMLQRERLTNRDLQQQLSKERETTANLEAKIKKVGEGGEGRVRELEGQLEEASHDHEELRQEVDRLTASLDQANQLKTQAEDSAQQLRSRCGELEKKLQETESADLAKLGQSIIQIPGESTEV